MTIQRLKPGTIVQSRSGELGCVVREEVRGKARVQWFQVLEDEKGFPLHTVGFGDRVDMDVDHIKVVALPD